MLFCRVIAAVFLTVTSATADQIVPDAIGLSLQQATSEMRALGLEVVSRGETSMLPTRSVISCNPLPGVVVSDGSTISVVVSEGISLPDFTGKRATEVIDALRAQGFDVKTEIKPIKPYAKGHVASQTPNPGVLFDASIQSVTLVVTEGKSAVVPPNLVEVALVDALKALSDAGLRGFVSEGPDSVGVLPWTCSPDTEDVCQRCDYIPWVDSIYPTSGTSVWPNNRISLFTRPLPSDECVFAPGICGADRKSCELK